MKRTIMLVCAAGMSTSLLVTKMQKAAEAKGIEAKIFAVSAGEAEDHLANEKIDVVLIGPQIRYMKAQLDEKVKPLGIGLEVIPMVDYGMMNGEKVLNQALSLIK